MIVLLRHGNTFGPGETPRMVGAHEDLPLVASGVVQAEAAARAFSGLYASAVVAGPLLRTREFAERLQLGPVRIDERLRELDYGDWSGLDDAQIIERYGAEALRDWREKGAWQPAFKEDEASARARIQAVIDAQPVGHVFIVSSNGLLRLLHPQGAPVGTGKACVLARPLVWNVTPDEARKALA